MSEFLKWHPSSEKGESLYSRRDEFIRDIYADPVNAFDSLEKQWRFGQVSEIWDDYIFDNLIRPALDKNSRDEISTAVCRYSCIDHLLFKTYVRREENPVRFRRAFWNLNVYGQKLSKRAFTYLNFPLIDLRSCSSRSNDLLRPRKIAFVLKGPYKLAHVEFLHSFLQGCAIFSSKVSVFLILLDAQQQEPRDIDHVEVKSFADIRNPFEKLRNYADYCFAKQFDNICWVACVQNLSLYMSMQLAPMQSYWSMKYHSIIMPSIQKYAGLGFGGKSFHFDDVEWYRGRAFPELGMAQKDISKTSNLKLKFNIPSDSVIIGCFVRAEKLHNKIFWESVMKILESNKIAHFVIACQYIPEDYKSYLSFKRFHHLGWVDTKIWSHCLDIYYDSTPRGSCNTIFEAIEAGVPVLMSDSAHNRESSALPYLASALKIHNNNLEIPGVYIDEEERLSKCLSMITDKYSRSTLANAQHNLLKYLQGQNQLFAKDYLNYFLTTNFKLGKV